MYWRLIDKSKTKRPTTGGYAAWKPELAEEGFHQCVYCAIDDNTFGGIRNYHVEHYRPKSLAQFKHLKDEFTNLFYACAVCNGFKGDDWKDNDSDALGLIGYPNPSQIDYADIFVVDDTSGLVTGKVVSSKYIAKRLCLNRPQLISYRRRRAIDRKREEARGQLDKQVVELMTIAKSGEVSGLDFVQEAFNSYSRVMGCLEQLERTTPYTAGQTKRT